jgi:hypothetical protein
MLMNVKGNIDKIIGRNIWGKVERKGFNDPKKDKKKQAVTAPE